VEAALTKEKNKDECTGKPGIYVNHLSIGHSMSEVVLEFGQVFDQASVCNQARLITSPTHLRSFQELMTNTLERYTAEFGPLLDADSTGHRH
jgi:Protein of unknown function (DUF3467)